MRCSHCGICCKETQMLLSESDVKVLEKAGYVREKFVRNDKNGFARLRNAKHHCVFYDVSKRCCTVYGLRPLGCRIYPVIYSEKEGVIVDDLCPMACTVSRHELDRKKMRLIRLLEKIDNEAENRGTDAST